LAWLADKLATLVAFKHNLSLLHVALLSLFLDTLHGTCTSLRHLIPVLLEWGYLRFLDLLRLLLLNQVNDVRRHLLDVHIVLLGTFPLIVCLSMLCQVNTTLTLIVLLQQLLDLPVLLPA
jgi:hypothetical protein